MATEKYLTTEQAAEYMGYAKATLIWWRGMKRGPTYVKVVGRVRYRPSDLDAWLDANTQTIQPSATDGEDGVTG